ncbi:MAG: class I SAM-dependent methyltransferase, partial [Aeromicrobium sp.]
GGGGRRRLRQVVSRPRDWAALANELGLAAAADGEPTRWYDELWSAAVRGDVSLPWDHTDPDPILAAWAAEQGEGSGRRAVVVGCGLGGDSEHLAALGWQTTAFDISPAAVRLARSRHPATSVDYRVGDLLALDADLVGAFDLVVEVFTVQAMPPTVRPRAIDGIRRLLAPGGTAVVVQFVRDGEDPAVGPPWLLDRREMESFADGSVALTSLRDEPSPRDDRDTRIWVARLDRSS